MQERCPPLVDAPYRHSANGRNRLGIGNLGARQNDPSTRGALWISRREIAPDFVLSPLVLGEPQTLLRHFDQCGTHSPHTPHGRVTVLVVAVSVPVLEALIPRIPSV